MAHCYGISRIVRITQPALTFEATEGAYDSFVKFFSVHQTPFLISLLTFKAKA